MKEKFYDTLSNIAYLITEKFSLFFSIGSLILNLLIFALVMREAAIMSLVLAGIFLVYLPIGYFDKQEEIWIKVSRVLEIVMAVIVSFAYILLFRKFWLLFLPVLEIAGGILFYIFVYRKVFHSDEK